MTDMTVRLIEAPGDADWMEVKRRALVTIGKRAINPPDDAWKHQILEARHSPIRYLRFCYYLEVPYWVSVHLARHVHAQPYIRSQRNDRQDDHDRNDAPQSAPVAMIFDVNAEELMVIANKRLCGLAAPETRHAVRQMCLQAETACPPLRRLLVPACDHYGKCHEMRPCGKSLHQLASPDDKSPNTP